MTVKDILKQLESMGDDARRKHNAKTGPDGIAGPEKQFGVKNGDIRALAKRIKTPDNHKLAMQLWETGNLDVQLLAALLFKPKSLSEDDVDKLTRSTCGAWAADWLNSYIVAKHPEKDALRERWMNPKEKNIWAARAGWHFTASRINKGANDLDVGGLLDRLEKEMPKAKPEVKWTMNNTLGAIGIKYPKHRKRAIAIGEKIGLYKDWPMSKGCIIPYVPVWVEEMVKRAG